MIFEASFPSDSKSILICILLKDSLRKKPKRKQTALIGSNEPQYLVEQYLASPEKKWIKKSRRRRCSRTFSLKHHPYGYEDEPMDPEIDEGEEVEEDNNNEDTPDPIEGDGDEKQEQEPAERPWKTSKYMTKYERARILGT